MKNLQIIVQCSNWVGICARTLLNNIKVDSVSMAEQPDLHKSKMAALAAKVFCKFSHKIVIVINKPFIFYFQGKGSTNILCFSN